MSGAWEEESPADRAANVLRRNMPSEKHYKLHGNHFCPNYELHLALLALDAAAAVPSLPTEQDTGA